MTQSFIVRFGKGLSRGYTAFLKRACNTERLDFWHKLSGAFLLFLVFGVPILIASAYAYDAWENFAFHRLTPAEHLTKAKAACGTYSLCGDTNEALRQLVAIPPTAPEYATASDFLQQIRKQAQIESDAAEKREQEKATLAKDRAEKNFSGQAQDKFDCETSRTNDPIVSFDDGTTWWKDDGRCTDILAKREEQAQKDRDENAKISSYWSTTVRVDTDMDSFWLPDEERTCQTFPDAKGKVATVTCDPNSHSTHNIPVVFWGGVDRNTVSDWKCRREKDVFSDQFVCRAID